MKTKCLILISGILAIIHSCRIDDIDFDCASAPCTGCLKRDSVSCWCVWDSVNYHCPSEMVHGFYHYASGWEIDSCYCRCERGWAGALCDQRDTNYYVSFLFGTDTLNLSGPIRTSTYSIDFDTSQFFGFTGSLPSGSEIDTLTLTQLKLMLFDSLSRPFCLSDSICNRLEMRLQSGETAIAVSGILSVDNLTNNTVLQGTFKANLNSSTGTNFYMRDGKYYLPLLR